MNEKIKLSSVSDLLRSTWTQYKTHLNVLVPIMLIAGIGLYAQSIVMFYGNKSMVENHLAKMDPTFAMLSLVASVVYLIGMIWGTSALLAWINRIDQPMTVKEAYANAKPIIWPVFITGFIVAILTLLGFVLLIIPGIIVGIWFTFSIYIVVAEHKKGMEAIKLSKSYVEGYWWAVFGRSMFVGILVGIVGAIIGTVISMLSFNFLGTIIQDIVTLCLVPFALIFQFSVYKELKKIKSSGTMPPVQEEEKIE